MHRLIAAPWSALNGEPEVLVRFKPGVSLAEIKRIAARNNDVLEDEIESVKGLVSIDDKDNADAEATGEQYSEMSDLVEYAQPNYEIQLDPTDPISKKDLVYRPNSSTPNDPQFGDQWARTISVRTAERSELISMPYRPGRRRAAATKWSLRFDSGVDYTHKDLVANMWTRPDAIPQYADDELGSFDDVHGFDADANAGDPMDDNGHGTHCAGIIGAEGDNGEGIAGINWNVSIMPLSFWAAVALERRRMLLRRSTMRSTGNRRA